jgi:transcriptional regulator with XRE-family HTH domain
MPVRGQLASAPPFAIEQAVKRLGRQLRTARLRRNISISEMAGKIGVDRHVVADAENGKLTTGIGVYAGMLWAMSLISQLDAVADPNKDDVGIAMARLDEREHAYPSRSLSNDF